MTRIKKFISFILSLTMMISIVTTVSASEIESPVTPTIFKGTRTLEGRYSNWSY